MTRKLHYNGDVGRENCDNKSEKKKKRVSASDEGKQRIVDCLQIFSLLSDLPTENSCCHEAGHGSRRAAACLVPQSHSKMSPTAYRHYHHPHRHRPRFTVIHTRKQRDEPF